MSTAIEDSATAPATPAQFTVVSRILHWLTAILVFSGLIIGFVMVNSVADYATLLTIHKTIGATILVVVVIRLINRITHRPPALPATVGRVERLVVDPRQLGRADDQATPAEERARRERARILAMSRLAG